MSGVSVPGGYEVRFFPYHSKLDRCTLVFADSDADAIVQAEILRDWRAMELWKDNLLVRSWPPANGKIYPRGELNFADQKTLHANQNFLDGVQPRSDL